MIARRGPNDIYVAISTPKRAEIFGKLFIIKKTCLILFWQLQLAVVFSKFSQDFLAMFYVRALDH